ncbi:MAG: adenosylmethionine decarboxylase [Burkholderiales bacterium]|nr:adenosylmethionine decarboxylase [Burkholderiales bacterium]
MEGLHVLATLHRCCSGARELVDSAALRALCVASIERAGLTAVGEVFHQFPGGGVTGCVVLAESHLAIHTWPELAAVTLDLYVCNFSGDNSARAQRVLDDVVRVFAPQAIERRDVPRGRLAAAGPLAVAD